jgi:hypothetical protein
VTETPAQSPSAEPGLSDAQAIIQARQPAYNAVYDIIADLPPTPDAAARNAHIWRAVHAALDAAKVGMCVSSHCAEGDHILIVTGPEEGL